jgi:hypothetical protein
VINNPVNASFSAATILNNQNPQFDSIDINNRYFDFHLKSNSPAINKGAALGIGADLDGRARVTQPDLGCYEKQ